MFQLVYKSQPTKGFEADDCSDILLAARSTNAEKGITGALLFTGSFFVQALEGPEEEVLALYTAISRDRRHKNIKCLSKSAVEEAEFGRWSMAFERMSIGDENDLEKQITFLLKDATDETRNLFLKFLEKARSIDKAA